jgi:hypothetical protein
MGIREKIQAASANNGITQLPKHTLVYLARRVGWKSTSLAQRLDDSLAERSILREYRSVLHRNGKFRNIHKDKRAFVIGNGPSLNRQDLGKLAGEVTFVTNSFWKHPIVDEWQPTYHFMADPILFDGSESVREYYRELTTRMPGSTFFVMHYAKSAIEEGALLPADRTYYLALGGGIERILTDGLDLTRMVPDIRSITELALMAAIYMGCNPIYLMGCDHDWLAHRGVHFNFYEGGDLQDHPQANSTLNNPYQDDLKNVLHVWNSYTVLKDYAGKRDIKIFNASAGGFLDVFDVVFYESLFEQK